jgi:hypothetical protein
MSCAAAPHLDLVPLPGNSQAAEVQRLAELSPTR